MDTNLEQKRNKLTTDFTIRINFLQQQIDNLTIQYTSEVKIRQDEIDALTLQSEALKNFDVTTSSINLKATSLKIQ